MALDISKIKNTAYNALSDLDLINDIEELGFEQMHNSWKLTQGDTSIILTKDEIKVYKITGFKEMKSIHSYRFTGDVKKFHREIQETLESYYEA